MSKFKDLCDALEGKIVSSYEDGVTMDQAEKLAGEFLYAQMAVSNELKKADLDSRMRKTGVKAIRATVYTEARSKAEKITEAALTALLDSNELVESEQRAFDEAEVNRDELERLYNVFQQAHVYFRQISKGSLG